MEYEKIIISLVDKNESVKAFVCFYKRADELILEIKGVKEKGVFCVWANGKMAFYELNKYNQFILSDNFNFFNDYFFMIKTQSCLYGTKGNITDADLIIKKFNKVIENFNKEDCEKMKVSKTQFVESVINKMFAKSNQMIFEYKNISL